MISSYRCHHHCHCFGNVGQTETAPITAFPLLSVLHESSSLWYHNVQHLAVLLCPIQWPFLSSSSALLPVYIAIVSCVNNWCPTVDAENQDANENGADEDMDQEVNGYDGWPSNSAAKVATAEASVNAARVAVCQCCSIWLQVIFCCQWMKALYYCSCHHVLLFKLSAIYN